MKKSLSKLALHAETLRVLPTGSLADVIGGSLETQPVTGIIIRPRITISCPQPSSPSHNSECDIR
jgi:hypothetical protein